MYDPIYAFDYNFTIHITIYICIFLKDLFLYFIP